MDTWEQVVAASHALRLLRAHRAVNVRRSGQMALSSPTDGHVRRMWDVAVAHASRAGSHP
ncbi:MAG: hypothetical protein NVS3B1_27780 [Marmoricola sp.]